MSNSQKEIEEKLLDNKKVDEIEMEKKNKTPKQLASQNSKMIKAQFKEQKQWTNREIRQTIQKVQDGSSTSQNMFIDKQQKIGNYLLQATISPDGTKILASQYGVYVYDIETLENINYIDAGDWVENGRFFSNGTKVAFANQTKKVFTYNLDTNEFEMNKEFPLSVGVVDVSSDNSCLLVGMKDSLQILDLIGNKKEKFGVIWEFSGQNDQRSQQTACFSSSGKLIASCQTDKSIAVFSNESGKEVIRFKNAHHIKPLSILFNKAEDLVISGGNGVKIWNLKNMSKVTELVAHMDVITGLALSPKEDLLASSSKDKTVILWNMENFSMMHKFIGHQNMVMSLFFTNESQLISASWDAELIFWNQKYGVEKKILTKHTQAVEDVACSPDGKYLASCSNDQTLVIWNAENFTEIQTFDFQKEVIGLNFSNKSKYLVVCTQEGLLNLYTTEDWQLKHSLVYDQLDVRYACFSPLDDRIVSCHRNSEVVIWDTEEGTQLKVLAKNPDIPDENGHDDTTQYCDYAPNQNSFVSCSRDREIKIWNAETFKLVATLSEHLLLVSCVKYSEDSLKLYSSSTDKNIIIWDLSRLDQFLKKPFSADTYKQFSKLRKIYVGMAIQRIFFQNNLIYAVVDQGINVYYNTNGAKIIEYQFHTQNTTTGCITKNKNDGSIQTIFTAGNDKTIIAFKDFRLQHYALTSYHMLVQSLDQDIHKSQRQALQSYAIQHLDSLASCYFTYQGISFLNLIIYYENFDVMNVYLKLVKKYQSKIQFSQDVHGLYPLQIALVNKNKQFAQNIIDFITQNTDIIVTSVDQPFLNEQVIANLFKKGFHNLGDMIESRFVVPLDQEIIKTKKFKHKYQLNNLALQLNDKDIMFKKCLDNEQVVQDNMNESKISLDKDEKNQYKQQEKEQLIETNLKILDIVGVLSPKSNLMQAISERDGDDPIFQSKILSHILQFKWKKYAEKEFMNTALQFLIYFILFNILIIIVRPYREDESANVRWITKIWSIGLYAATSVFSIKFILNEIEQMQKYGIKSYFLQVWNYFDLSANIFPLLVAILDVVSILQSDIIGPFNGFLRFFSSLGIFFVWIKLLTFSRGFENLAFLLRMIQQVVINQRFFFVVTFWTAIAFASASFAIQNWSQSNTDGKSYSYFRFLGGFYNVMLGNYDFFQDKFKGNSDMNIYVNFLYFIVSLYLQIVMMNLLISFLGDAYGKVNSEKEQSFNYELTQIINEIDLTMNEGKKNKLHEELGTSLLIIKQEKEGKAIVDDTKDRQFDKQSSKISKIKNFIQEVPQKQIFDKILSIDNNQKGMEKDIRDLQAKFTSFESTLDEIKKLLQNK